MGSNNGQHTLTQLSVPRSHQHKLFKTHTKLHQMPMRPHRDSSDTHSNQGVAFSTSRQGIELANPVCSSALCTGFRKRLHWCRHRGCTIIGAAVLVHPRQASVGWAPGMLGNPVCTCCAASTACAAFGVLCRARRTAPPADELPRPPGVLMALRLTGTPSAPMLRAKMAAATLHVTAELSPWWAAITWLPSSSCRSHGVLPPGSCFFDRTVGSL